MFLLRQINELIMKQEILFVDDEAPIRDLLADFFRQKGYTTRTAATGEEALQSLAQQTPSLVMLDVDLGATDGLALLETIRASHPSLPVIMLTGMGFDNELLAEAMKKGANGYASKMLSLEHLLMEVHRVLKAAGKSAGEESRPEGNFPYLN